MDTTALCVHAYACIMCMCHVSICGMYMSMCVVFLCVGTCECVCICACKQVYVMYKEENALCYAQLLIANCMDKLNIQKDEEAVNKNYLELMTKILPHASLA